MLNARTTGAFRTQNMVSCASLEKSTTLSLRALSNQLACRVHARIGGRALIPTCITVASAKGGVGKTTTAVSTSHSLARHLENEKEEGIVLLIDFDPQCHATIALDLEPGSGRRKLSEVFAEATSDRRGESAPLHEVAIDTRIPKLSVLPGDPLLEGAVARPGILARIIRPYVEQIAYCVIDTPPAMSFLTANALHAQAEFPRGMVLTPIQQARFSLEGLSQFLDALHEISEINPRIDSDNLRILLTMVDPRVKRTRSYVERELSTLKEKVLRSSVRRSEDLNHSQSCGKTIFEYNPMSNAAVDYWSVAGEILTILERQEKEAYGANSSRTEREQLIEKGETR